MIFINVLPCRATVFGDQFITSETSKLRNKFKYYIMMILYIKYVGMYQIIGKFRRHYNKDNIVLLFFN